MAKFVLGVVFGLAASVGIHGALGFVPERKIVRVCTETEEGEFFVTHHTGAEVCDRIFNGR